MARLVVGSQCPRRTTGVCSADAAPASPSRPSTHRSRVPTAFLSTRPWRVQGRLSGRSPSSIDLRDPLGDVVVVGLRRLAHHQQCLDVGHVDVGAHRARLLGGGQQFVERRQERRFGARRDRLDVDPLARQRVDQPVVGRGAAHHGPQEDEQRLARALRPSAASARGRRCGAPGPRRQRRTAPPWSGSAGRPCPRRRRPAGRSRRSGRPGLRRRTSRRRPRAPAPGCGPRQPARPVGWSHFPPGEHKAGRTFRIVVDNRGGCPVCPLRAPGAPHDRLDHRRHPRPDRTHRRHHRRQHRPRLRDGSSQRLATSGVAIEFRNAIASFGCLVAALAT